MSTRLVMEGVKRELKDEDDLQFHIEFWKIINDFDSAVRDARKQYTPTALAKLSADEFEQIKERFLSALEAKVVKRLERLST